MASVGYLLANGITHCIAVESFYYKLFSHSYRKGPTFFRILPHIIGWRPGGRWELRVFAVAIVAAGGARGLRTGALGRRGKVSGGKEVPAMPPGETPSVGLEIHLS